MYRPPNETVQDHANFTETSSEILDKMSNYPAYQHLLTGDLNFGNLYCKEPILNPKPLDYEACDLFASNGMTQIIDIPTRFSQTCASLIDLIYVSKIDDVMAHGTINGPADHEGVFCSFTTLCSKPKARTIQIYDYENVDLVALFAYLDKIDFQESVFNLNVIDQPSALSNILINALKKFVPCKSYTARALDQPWSTAKTRQLLRKKNRNYKIFKEANIKYLNTKSNPNSSVETVALDNA